jgi:hypothetical protein
MNPRFKSKAVLTSALAMGLLASGSANAATGTCSLTDLASCNMTLEGITYSNFSFSGFTPVPPGASVGDVFNLSGAANGSGTVTLSFTPDRLADIPNGFFSYTITLNNRYFNRAQSNLTGSTLGGGDFFTSLTAPGLVAPAVSFGGAGAPVSFNPNLMSQTISQSFQYDFVASPDTLSAVGGSFTSVPVPGPVPVLAVGTAFCFSRKLRQRIKLVG